MYNYIDTNISRYDYDLSNQMFYDYVHTIKKSTYINYVTYQISHEKRQFM